MGGFSSFQNIFKIAELKSRVLFTLGLLAVYRVGAHIPTPGINGEELSNFLTERGGALMGFFDMFSGGALSRVTVFALGIMPYISASIIFQLLTVVIPAIGKLAKEGEAGRKKITKYTRYATIGISMIQSFGIAVGLESMADGAFIANPGWSFRLLTMLTLTSGTAFIMWLGEQITERGIGNGISLIIFAGIVARFPAAIISTVNLMRAGELSIFFVIALVAMMVGVILAPASPYCSETRSKSGWCFPPRALAEGVIAPDLLRLSFSIARDTMPSHFAWMRYGNSLA